jgi:hypothetical protein
LHFVLVVVLNQRPVFVQFEIDFLPFDSMQMVVMMEAVMPPFHFVSVLEKMHS